MCSKETWEEVDIALKDRRHELRLNGDKVSAKLQACNGHLPEKLFEISSLNYLEISDTALTEIEDEIGGLSNLINLALHRNQIQVLSSSIGLLDKLKFLDLSFNKLTDVPSNCLSLPCLHTLNLGNNELKSLPSFSNLKQLGIVFLDHNKLENLPPDIYELGNLSEIHAAGNSISVISWDIGKIGSLKILDLAENLITKVPASLSQCSKLKDLNIKSNPISDNRLKKMLNQCNTKSVLDYVSAHGEGSNPASGPGKQGGKKNRNKEQISSCTVSDDLLPKVHILHANHEEQRVVVLNSASFVRPYIVCTIMKQLDLSEPGLFRKFISLQTSLHEELCDMRTKGTIATHTLSSLKFPLKYEAVPPVSISMAALGKTTEASALNIIEELKAEREKMKQKKKRQAKAGLFKFIELVDGKDLFCCLRDADDHVISLPPLTNSERTKVSSSIHDVFVEVTSPVSLPVCKTIMDELVGQVFKAGFRSRHVDDTLKGLVLQQVRVVDQDLNLKVVYPSKVDLVNAEFSVHHVDAS